MSRKATSTSLDISLSWLDAIAVRRSSSRAAGTSADATVSSHKAENYFSIPARTKTGRASGWGISALSCRVP